MKKLGLILVGAAVLVGASIGISSQVLAINNTNLTQVINPGVLTTDIRDGSNVPVANPAFALGATTFSFGCQTTTGTLGTASQRIYVENPGAADSGWTTSIAATDGTSALWANSGATQTFDFNDPAGSGCTAGQLSLDPSAGTVVIGCDVGTCTTTGITKGSNAAFNGATAITLLNAAASSDNSGRWYFTGTGISQKIPAAQSVDSYSINLTVTTTAL